MCTCQVVGGNKMWDWLKWECPNLKDHIQDGKPCCYWKWMCSFQGWMDSAVLHPFYDIPPILGFSGVNKMKIKKELQLWKVWGKNRNTGNTQQVRQILQWEKHGYASGRDPSLWPSWVFLNTILIPFLFSLVITSFIFSFSLNNNIMLIVLQSSGTFFWLVMITLGMACLGILTRLMLGKEVKKLVCLLCFHMQMARDGKNLWRCCWRN